MTNRDNALQSANAMAQQVWEWSHEQGSYAIYAERDGRLTVDEYVGNYHERQSVYYNESGCAERLMDIGLGSACWGGSDTDYRDMAEPISDSRLPDGEYVEEYLDPDRMPNSIAAAHPDGLYWDGVGWCPLEDSICAWQDRCFDGSPSQPLIDAIEALPQGWFDDEDDA